jgi:hypothetical protein
MSQDFLDESYQHQPRPVKRPVFLLVLCILTFVSCGLTFCTTIFSLISVGSQKQSFQQFNRMSQQQQEDLPEIAERMANALEKTADWTIVGNYLSLGNIAFCLVGALLMWRMRKVGFFIYTFGQLLPIITLYGVYSLYQNVPIMGVFMLITSIFTVLISAAFVVMYGLNLKHMR